MPEGYRLGAAGFVPVPIMPPLPAAPDHNVIDSFLLADGVVSGLGLHIDRFVRSVSGFVSLGVSAAELASMVRACLPQVGEWFPRLECHAVDRGGPCEVYLRVRPAPARRAVTRLWVPSGSDPRERSEIKGWDLPALTDMRAEAVRQGADDALLRAAGTCEAIEITTGVLVAWVGDHLVTADVGVLPSVTWRRTIAGVRVAGIRVVSGAVGVEELRLLPCAVGNALHGWTPVVAIHDSHTVTRNPTPPVDLNRFLR